MIKQDILDKINNIIFNNQVVVFMKGTKTMPMCGFSSRVVQILNSLNINFYDVNILDDIELRESLKTFSNWPTYPQLYVKGELIGGCDIVTTLYQNNELQAILNV